MGTFSFGNFACEIDELLDAAAVAEEILGNPAMVVTAQGFTPGDVAAIEKFAAGHLLVAASRDAGTTAVFAKRKCVSSLRILAEASTYDDGSVLCSTMVVVAQLERPFCDFGHLVVGTLRMNNHDAAVANMDRICKQIASLCLAHSVRLLGGRFPDISEFMLVLRREGIACNLAAWLPFGHAREIWVHTTAVVAIGPLEATTF